MYYNRCEECNFISTDMKMLNPKHPCPHCNKIAGEDGRRMFPHLDAQVYRRMIHKNSVNESQNTRQILQEAAGILKMSYIKTKELFDDLTLDKDESFEKAIGNIRTKIGVDGNEAVIYEILTLTNKYASLDEMKICFILVDTYVESLLLNFIDEIMLFENLSGKIRMAVAAQIRTRKQMISYIESYIGKKLKNIIPKMELGEGFYADICNIREQRNKFIHGYPYAIGRDDYKRAINISKNAVAIFIDLNNMFLLKGNAN